MRGGQKREATTISGVLSGKLHSNYGNTSLRLSRTPDGTSIITNSADNQIRTFIAYACVSILCSATDHFATGRQTYWKRDAILMN
jgi:hypothetical protein